eukprot:TRINITY_DN6093_c0_g1_i2.p1 TRINITY_DN6093_c0_g1~~TRINITY_DN6093_c0_g1_i2.p1  ORF type:complete len:300 (+),score=56.70 TRINITY_DN6093_c0_g1_i2:158-1057(+)
MSQLRVLLGGGSGFVGRALSKALREQGHAVTIISRSEKKGDITWQRIDKEGLPPCDAVVNLAGENVLNFTRFWTDSFKAEVRSSRIGTTQLLAKAISTSTEPPKAFVVSSGVGYYQNHPFTEGITNTEASPPGKGFMCQLAVDWERAAQLSEGSSTRVVNVRSGVVLGKGGGAYAQMKLPFSLGLGGPISKGHQIFPWIHLDDIVGLYMHAIVNPDVKGPINGVAPQIINNLEFTRSFATALRRWAFIPVPSFALNLGLGSERAVMLLEGQRVVPEVALQTGYEFKHPTIDDAFADLTK